MGEKQKFKHADYHASVQNTTVEDPLSEMQGMKLWQKLE